MSGSAPASYTDQDYISEKEGGVVMINGQVNPVLHIRPGQVQRWRIINESQARYYSLSLENHTMYLVGTHGGLLDKPYALNDILLPPGERVDMLVWATRGSGIYRLLSLPYNRGANQLQQITLLTLSYKGTSLNNGIPSSINPNTQRLDVNSLNIAASRTLYLISEILEVF